MNRVPNIELYRLGGGGTRSYKLFLKIDGVQHKWMVCSTDEWCAAQMDGVQQRLMLCSRNGWCAAQAS